jgi:hypothetical protein
VCIIEVFILITSTIFIEKIFDPSEMQTIFVIVGFNLDIRYLLLKPVFTKLATVRLFNIKILKTEFHRNRSHRLDVEFKSRT